MEYLEDYLDLMREFEVKKRSIEPRLESRITFRIPITLYELYRQEHGGELREAVRQNPTVSDKVTFAGDKMRVEAETVKSLFADTTKQIIVHLQLIFANPVAKGASTILMVGGFSESLILRDAVQCAFPEYRVVTPHEAGLAVLKGAVIFGHNSTVITSRIAKYTYGMKCWSDFDSNRHPRERMVLKDGRQKVQGTFRKLVEVGQSVSIDNPSSPQGFCPVEGDSAFTVKLFASPKPDPIFIDEEDCISIGEVQVDCKDSYGRISAANVSLIFGGTELEVRAVHSTTGRQTSAKFNFLE